MSLSLRLQLSVMMFLQFFIWGAWYVTGPNYLGTVGFEASDFGWMYSVGPISAMISPFFVGMVADRFFPAQRVLGILHLLGAVLLGLMSFSLPHTPPTASGPVSARQVLGLDALVLLKDRSYLAFLVASTLICIPLAFYYQIASRVVEMADFSSFGLMQTIQQAIQAGDVIAATMSLGQVSEIVFMLVMPFFFRRLGVKWMLAVGMAAWVLRYGLFALGASDQVRWMILVGVLLHGICYDFFFVTGQIYTDQKAPRQLRAQAQGLLVLFTLGLGMAIGAQVAGRIEAANTPQASITLAGQRQALAAQLTELKQSDPDPAAVKKMESELVSLRQAELQAIEWKQLWAIPAVFAAVILALFLLFFRERRDTSGLSDKKPGAPQPALE